MGLPHPCLMLITEPRDDLASVVERAVSGGVNAVLWRDARARIGKRDPTLTGLVSATGERAVLIGAGSWEAFVPHGLRAVHLPERSAPVGVVKYRIGAGALVGKSVGSVADAVRAESTGADYVVVDGGLELLREVCASVRVSVLSGGEVTPRDAESWVRAGAAGITVSSPVMQAADPKAAASQYRAALEAAWTAPKAGG